MFSTSMFSTAMFATAVLAVGAVTASAAELLEPPMPFAEGGTGDANTNEGHAVSADGRFVVFTSFATNLVANDSNGARDVFVWDTALDTVQLVSRASPETQANGDSSDAVISADGQWVAFSSSADNLASDSNGSTEDVFLFSRIAGTLTLVSRDSSGAQSDSAALRPDINANGRYVTFDSTGEFALGGGSQNQVYRRDSWSDTTRLISQTPEGIPGNGLSMDAQMSADGERVVFVSDASNLVSTATVGKDSYLRDLRDDRLELLTLTASGEAGDGISYFPALSGDGRFAAFHSNASNLVPDDRADVTDVLLRDIESGEMTLLSRDVNGVPGDDFSIHPSLSFDGQRVAFATNAPNLVAGDAPAHVDVVLVDRLTSTIDLLSQTAGGGPANGDSAAPSISFDGTSVAFSTLADNLSLAGTPQSDALLARIDSDDSNSGGSSPVALAAAVLPSSRSVQLGDSLTAFASVLGTGLASDCGVRLSSETDEDLPVELRVQATNPATNAVVGVEDSPFLLLPETPQTLLLTLTPTGPFSAQEIAFEFFCGEDSAAPVAPGTNTLLVSAESVQPPDVVALVATLENDGIVSLSEDAGGVGVFSIASINIGAASDLVVRPVVQGMALDSVAICQTDPLTSVCLESPGDSVSLAIATGATPTFAVFLANAGPVPFLPAENRLAVQFEDATGLVRGRTSVAVRSITP